MRLKIKISILKALHQCDGIPMPEGTLWDAARLMVRPADPSLGDFESALREAESEGYVAGVTDDFTKEKSWTLTEKGKHKARQLK